MRSPEDLFVDGGCPGIGGAPRRAQNLIVSQLVLKIISNVITITATVRLTFHTAYPKNKNDVNIDHLFV